MLLDASKILEGKALTERNSDSQRLEYEHFRKILKHFEDEIFSDAHYKINQNRQEKLRLPTRMPSDEAVHTLRNFTVSRIERLVDMFQKSSDDFGKTEYVELRNCLCSRLTLFNARRGGEPSRTKISHWTERGKWIDKENMADENKEFFRDMDIYYAPGKGNHLVDTLVPKDSLKALRHPSSP